jgi:hypothetical protein
MLLRPYTDRGIRFFEMDGFLGSAGASWTPPQTDEQPETKRRRLNPDEQPFHWHSQRESTIPYTGVLAKPHWSPSLYNAYSTDNAHIQYQNPDCYQQLPIQLSDEGLIGNTANLNQPPDELEPDTLGLSIAQSSPQEKDVLVCYGMVSSFSFDRTAFSTLCYPPQEEQCRTHLPLLVLECAQYCKLYANEGAPCRPC